MDRLDPKSGLLLVVDVQERLAAAMPQAAMDRLLAGAAVLLESARLLGVPVVVSEQYPKGLGPTVAPIAQRLAAMGVTPIDKMSFDACSELRIARAIGSAAPRSVVVAGMETHICVFQTARELVRLGYDVHVASDAVASRREEHRERGLELCERAGAYATPVETIAFDWLGRAGSDEFKAISKMLK
jgi:nicotinamidase-related amidase